MNRLALPESGERKRNLTTTGLGENKRQSETRPVPTKPSQSPLRIRSVQVEGVKELVNDKVTSHEGPMAIQGEAQPGNGQPRESNTAQLGYSWVLSKVRGMLFGTGRRLSSHH